LSVSVSPSKINIGRNKSKVGKGHRLKNNSRGKETRNKINYSEVILKCKA